MTEEMLSELTVRVKTLMNEKGIQPAELSKRSGIPISSLSEFLNGKVNKLSIQRAQKMCKVLDCTLDYLIEGNGVELEDTREASLANIKLIPIIGSVAAGFNVSAIEDIIGYETAEVPNIKDYVFLKVKGNSMEPAICEGDLALIKMQNDVDSGSVAVVIVNGDDATIKKVIKQDKALVLQPFNNSYPTKIYTGKELNDIRIFGKVIETKRKW